MKLDVLLVTYNHARFIEEALNSICMQVTDFEYRLVVADDCSCDETLQLIKSHPIAQKMNVLYLDSSVNLGIIKNYQRSFAECDSEYVAVLEGDDFWTAPNRLQLLVDYLDHHRECSMAFNRYVVADYENCKFTIQPSWAPSSKFEYITSRNLANDNLIGNFSTCVYRKSALKKIPPELYELTTYDWFTNMMIGFYGLIGYCTEVMSVYRFHSSGTWSGMNQQSKLQSSIKCIDAFNEFTGGVLSDELNTNKSRLKSKLVTVSSIPPGAVGTLKKTIRAAARILKDFTPPLIVYILKALIPPVITKRIRGL